MRYPGEVYVRSNKEYKGLPEVEFPFHDKTITVTHCGRLCLKGKKNKPNKCFRRSKCWD